MNKLNRNIFLCVAFIALSVVSCKDDKVETNYDEYTDARIIKFNLLKSDTLFTGWEKTFFVIDQSKGEIYNNDSLPKHTATNKLLTKIEYASASKVQYKALNSNTLSENEEWKEYKNTDSLDFSSPLVFQVTALDKKTIKEYVIKVNVHTQDPDSLHWQKVSSDRLAISVASEKSVLLNNKLYTLAKSRNGELSLFESSSFNEIDQEYSSLLLPNDTDIETLTASENSLWVSTKSGKLYKSNGSSFEQIYFSQLIKLIGWIGKSQQNSPRLILKTIEENPRFVTYKTESNEWIITQHLLPYGFPEHGFGKCNHIIGSSTRLTLVGGTFNDNPSRRIYQFMLDADTLQCSEDLLSSITPSNIVLRETTGNSTFIYDNRMFTFEGFPYYSYSTTVNNSQVQINSNRLIYSKNMGINWKNVASKESLPKMLSQRSHSSIIVDKDNFIWIVGGLDKDGNPINDLWKGRINRFGFIIQ